MYQHKNVLCLLYSLSNPSKTKVGWLVDNQCSVSLSLLFLLLPVVLLAALSVSTVPTVSAVCPLLHDQFASTVHQFHIFQDVQIYLFTIRCESPAHRSVRLDRAPASHFPTNLLRCSLSTALSLLRNIWPVQWVLQGGSEEVTRSCWSHWSMSAISGNCSIVNVVFFFPKNICKTPGCILPGIIPVKVLTLQCTVHMTISWNRVLQMQSDIGPAYLPMFRPYCDSVGDICDWISIFVIFVTRYQSFVSEKGKRWDGMATE